MATILIVCKNKEDFSSFAAGLEDHRTVQILWAESAERARARIRETPVALVIVGEILDDMTGLAFVRKLVSENPLMNCALASGLSTEDFHESTEGLGILMHLPPSPSKEDAGRLLDHAGKIMSLGG